jgi:hypothetical protein
MVKYSSANQNEMIISRVHGEGTRMTNGALCLNCQESVVAHLSTDQHEGDPRASW